MILSPDFNQNNPFEFCGNLESSLTALPHVETTVRRIRTVVSKTNSQHTLPQGILHPLDARCAIDVGAAAIAGAWETRNYSESTWHVGVSC